MLFRVAVVLVLASAMIGVSEGGKRAEAAVAAPPVPNPCPQWDCKVMTYWWTGGLKATGAFAPNTNGTVITNTAYADVFATTSDYKGKPKAVNKGRFDAYSYNSCTPTCGKDANGVWQALQEVAPVGPNALDRAGALQFTCDRMPAGQVGPTNPNPQNSNSKNKNSPPGYTD
jgi:hypothetical protein